MEFGFIPTEGGSLYEQSLREVMLGEELGFDSAWIEEHHGVANHYWPSPILVLAGWATRTSRILLGTDIAILPLYHPIRLAEDVALLDIMSSGRIVLGVAVGYRPQEFALYNVALEERGARTSEAINLIRRLWADETVTFKGKYYSVSDARIEPRPRRPVPIWIGGWDERALRRAAEMGDAWIPGPTANLEKLLNARATYQRYLARAGRKPAQFPTPLTREVVIADTEARARELAERHLLINYRDEYGKDWSHPLIGREDSTPVDRLDDLGRDRFLVGTPEQVIHKIKRFQEAFGVDHLICRLYFPGMPHEHILTELRLLAKEVMPAFARDMTTAGGIP